MIRRTPVVVGAIGIAVVGGLWQLTRRSADPVAVPAEQSTTSASAASTDQLARDVRLLRNQVSQLNKQQTAKPDPPAAPERESEPLDETTEHEDAVFMEAADSLDVAIENQSRDTAWAERTEARMHEALQAEDIDADIVSATCRSTVCRLEARVVDRSSADELLGQLTEREPFSTTGFAHLPEGQSDEDQRVILFFAREGHGLPI